MSITVDVRLNRFGLFAAALAEEANRIAATSARELATDAIATCPVSDRTDKQRHGLPHMRDTIEATALGDTQWEVSVQKEQAAAGESTWAWFNNDGTVHYAGSHWFSDACVRAGAALDRATLFDEVAG